MNLCGAAPSAGRHKNRCLGANFPYVPFDTTDYPGWSGHTGTSRFVEPTNPRGRPTQHLLPIRGLILPFELGFMPTQSHGGVPARYSLWYRGIALTLAGTGRYSNLNSDVLDESAKTIFQLTKVLLKCP